MLDLGWFSTGRGPGSRALLTTIHEAISNGRIDARIRFVFSNRAPGEYDGSDQFFSLANSLDLTVVHHSSRAFRRRWPGNPTQWRAAYDAEISNLIAPFSPDLCVLAGYMLIVSADLCRNFTMINLHPAAPDGPEGTWQDVIWQLIGEHPGQSGVKIHLVTEELDQGPTIAYCRYPIRGGSFDNFWKEADRASMKDLRRTYGEEFPLFKAIRAEGLKRELPLLVETLAAISRDDIRLTPDNPSPPQDLTSQIEASLSGA